MNLKRVCWVVVVICALAACEQSEPAAAVEPNQTAVTAEPDRLWRPNDERVFPERLSYENALGVVTTVNLAGATDTRDHPFFTPLGKNGRACVSCHQPADGMSVSAATLQASWDESGGRDPVFAAIDGANCPNQPPLEAASHSLLLRHGLFRIVRPWPPRAVDGAPREPEFDLEVVRDPARCNTDPEFGVAAGYVSVYRRPRPATNLRYVLAAGFAFDPKNGLPLRTDPATGALESGNLLSDDRFGTLPAQALDALVSHTELLGELAPADLDRIVAFERGLYTAQSVHAVAGDLAEDGALGGPDELVKAPAGVLQSSAKPIWSEFFGWDPPPAAGPAVSAAGSGGAPLAGSGGVSAAHSGDVPAAGSGAHDPRDAFRRSVARGAQLFSKRMFLVTDSAGITDMGFGNPVRNSCAFCHNMHGVGLDVAPGQIDLGTTNRPFIQLAPNGPAAELPLFRLTCRDGKRPHQHLGRVVYTHDPGYALTTGRCIDIGKITAQPMRGLAARAPYFSNGAAKTIREIVDFYEERYSIGLTEEEKQDLTRFLEVL